MRTFEEHGQREFFHKVVLYDGDRIPYQNDFLDAAISWYVFEHIAHPGPVLREVSRVVRQGGVLRINFQDPQICYEGHANIPWPPFMPKYVRDIWMEEFSITERSRRYIETYCFENTTQQISGILKYWGWEIVEESPVPQCLIPRHVSIGSESEIRLLAREVRESFEAGLYPAHQYPFIKARKLNL